MIMFSKGTNENDVDFLKWEIVILKHQIRCLIGSNNWYRNKLAEVRNLRSNNMAEEKIIMHKATSMNSILCGIPTFTVNAGWTGNSEKVTCSDCLQIMEIQSHNTQPNMNKVEFIAAVRHIGWITYQIAAEQSYNEEVNDDQHKSLIDGVIFALKNPNITPEENHENWIKMKLEQGWKYGDIKDFEKKTHPDLVRYRRLPDIEKRKDTADNVSHRLALELWNRITR